MKRSRFLHISDLHFFNSDHLKGKKDNLSHFEIKKQNLAYISSMIFEKQIGAILISGDLELSASNDLVFYIKEWLIHGAKVFIVFGEHDSLEMRESFILATRDLNGVYVFDEPFMAADEALEFNVFGMSCRPRQSGFKDKYTQIQLEKHRKPGIFLTHPCNLPKEKMRQLGFKYYAVGHIHFSHIDRVGTSYIGRPGHLYSLWDGSGKAWPARGILGEFNNDELQLDLLDFPSPQTVRIYVDPFNPADGKSPLVIENCSKEKAGTVSKSIGGKWFDEGFRGVYKAFINENRPDFEDILRGIITVFSDDILVTPSDQKLMKRKYGSSRAVFTGKSLLKESTLFEEYMERIIKASSKTQ